MNEQILEAKRNALVRAIGRRLHEVVREEFSMLEDGKVLSHCLAVSATLVDGLVAEVTVRATGAFERDAGVLYRGEVK